jgi:hypothetical protein
MCRKTGLFDDFILHPSLFQVIIARVARDDEWIGGVNFW